MTIISYISAKWLQILCFAVLSLPIPPLFRSFCSLLFQVFSCKVILLLFQVFRCWVVQGLPKGDLVLKDKRCSPNNRLCKSREVRTCSTVCCLHIVQQSHLHLPNLLTKNIICSTTVYIIFSLIH